MIEEIITLLMPKVEMSSGTDLEGFISDMDYSLSMMQASVFKDVNINISEDPHSLLNVSASVQDSVASIQKVWYAIKNMFVFVGYSDLQSVSIQAYREATICRFITVLYPSNLCVTGTLIVGSSHYDELVNKFIKEYNGNEIKNLPNGLPDWVVWRHV